MAAAVAAPHGLVGIDRGASPRFTVSGGSLEPATPRTSRVARATAAAVMEPVSSLKHHSALDERPPRHPVNHPTFATPDSRPSTTSGPKQRPALNHRATQDLHSSGQHSSERQQRDDSKSIRKTGRGMMPVTATAVRPDDVVSLARMTLKRNAHLDPSASRTPASANLELAQVRSRLTVSGESAIAAKEDRLEQLMSIEAYANFEQVARHHLHKHLVTRVAVDPDKLHDVDKLPQPSGSEDLEDDVCESDNELIVQAGGLEEFETSPESVNVPEELASAPGLHLGFGMANPRAEQERLFVAHCDNFVLVGLVNAHGKQGVSSSLAQLAADELPVSVFRSSALTRLGDPARALSDAFCRLHRRAASELDVRLTGAAVTLVLLDPEHVWVAHVGDCRAVLAVPDHRDNAESFHFTPTPLTQDHKLSVRSEFDRIQSCGGEMRKMVGDNVYRLFVKDTDVPGLTLTRGIGHRMGHLAGVSHFPSVAALKRADLAEGAFLLLGSGGLWHTMSEKAAVNWVGTSYHDPAAAATALSREALRRWEDKQRPEQRSLHQDVEDCFSVAVLLLDRPDATEPRKCQQPPSFTLGQHSMQTDKRSWAEVKSADRTLLMRRKQANGRPLAEDILLREHAALSLERTMRGGTA